MVRKPPLTTGVSGLLHLARGKYAVWGATIFANDNVKLLFTSPMAVTKRLAAHVVADR